MKEQPLLNILHKLGIVPQEKNGNWIQVSCPLAFKTHAGGRDETPSCGVSIGEDISVVHCFTCGTHKLSDVLHILTWTKGVKKDVHKYFLEHEFLGSEDTKKTEYKDKFVIESEIPEPVPQEVLSLFEPIKNASDYLTFRGISLQYAYDYGLLYGRQITTAQNKTWSNFLVFPIKDLDNKTYWLHFRSIEGKRFWHGKPEHFGYDFEWGRTDSWFGIQFLDITKPIILVEGIADCLRLRTLGLSNVIASHGGITRKSKKLIRLVNMNPKMVYLGFDANEAGQRMAEEAKKVFKCPTRVLDWSKVGCDDPGELKSKEDLETVLKDERNFKFHDKFQRSLHELV